jgi:hypothetical protein
MIDESLKAWAAGLFEGEGTVRIHGRIRRRTIGLYVAVGNTSKELIEPLAAWGGKIGLHHRAATARRKNQQPSWRWNAYPSVAERFLRDIQPFLMGYRNKLRVSIALDFQAQKQVGGHVDADYWATQLVYFQLMKILNARGLSKVEEAQSCHCVVCKKITGR